MYDVLLIYIYICKERKYKKGKVKEHLYVFIKTGARAIAQ